MTTATLIYYLHYLSIFTVVSGVVSTHVLLRKVTPRSNLQMAWITQMAVLGGLVLVLLSGLLQWFQGEKPALLYTKNALFHTKVTLFLIVAGLSVLPTRFLAKARHGAPEDLVTVDKLPVMALRGQLLLLFTMPLLALWVARGVGYYGS